MEPYLAVLREIAPQFDEFELTKIPRGENTSADALAALASTSNPALRRVIQVEGIEKPIINLPCKEIDPQGIERPRIGAIITQSRARGVTQSRGDEIDSELNDRRDQNEPPVRARKTTTTVSPLEEADHEANNEAHKAFQKELEARPDWRIPIYNYIKDVELPDDRWEARKLKARCSRYCIIEEKLYKRSINEPYLLSVSPKDAFTILHQTH